MWYPRKVPRVCEASALSVSRRRSSDKIAFANRSSRKVWQVPGESVRNRNIGDVSGRELRRIGFRSPAWRSTCKTFRRGGRWSGRESHPATFGLSISPTSLQTTGQRPRNETRCQSGAVAAKPLARRGQETRTMP